MGHSAADLFAQARAALSDAAREPLGTIVQPRRILGIARAPKITPAGQAWHLGVFLLTDDAVLATGEVVRSRHDAVRGYTAESQRHRSMLAAAAHRGGFAEGTAVHIGWRAIDLDALGDDDAAAENEAVREGAASDLLRIADGQPVVRWSTRGGWMPLAGYLRERVELLRHPPAGAT